MSEQEASDKMTFKAYAQLPYKPFKFTEPTEQLNLRLVANIDPDQLYYRGDLDQASAVLKNFVNSHIPEEMDYEMFNKLFRLSQLAIEYYSQEQANRQQVIDDQYLKYKQLQEQEKNLNELKIKHNEKKETYKEQIKQLSKKIKEMKKEAERIGSYKCVYCSKAYRDKDGLDSHVKRRHLDMLNEIQETKDMIKERQDPIYQLKKKQQDEIREQNKIQLERLQELQKQLEQAKINEAKLVEQITSKLQQDFDMKISQVITLQNEEKQKEIEKSSKILQQKEEIQQKNQIKEQEINTYLEKMNQNLENFQKNFSKIQEQQEKMTKQQEEYTKQLDKISQNQEELKKSSLQQSALIKEQQSMYVGNIVSNKTVPLPINTKQNSKQEQFPVQAHPTADFQNATKQPKTFFNQEEEDSFLNNNSSVIDDQQIREFKGLNPKSGFLQAKVIHIGDLEDDFDSEDENRKSYLKQKQESEIRNQIQQELKNDKQDQSKVNPKSQTYIYQDPSNMSIENNNKNQNGVKSLSTIQDQDLFGLQRMSQTQIDDDKQKLKNMNNTKTVSKKQIEEQNKIDESEEKLYFQSESNNTQETPRQPNVLSNQMSFGAKGLEVGSEQNLGRKSMFSSQKGKKLDELHISEQPSKEQQKSLANSEREQNDKKDKKENKNKGDKKDSFSISDEEINSSSSSLSDISARMKDNYKKKNKNSNHSSKKSIGNVKDIPSPHPKDDKDSKSKQILKKSSNQFEEDSKNTSKNQIEDDKRKKSQEVNQNSQNNSFGIFKKDLNEAKGQLNISDNQKLKENNANKEEEPNNKPKEENVKTKESEESSFLRRGSKDSFTNLQQSPRESKNQISQKDTSNDQKQSFSLPLMQPPPDLASHQQDSIFDKIQKTDSIPTQLGQKQQSDQEIKGKKLSKFGQRSLDTEQQNKSQTSLNKIDSNESEKNKDLSDLQQKKELDKSDDKNKLTTLQTDNKQIEEKQDKQASLSQNQPQQQQNDLLKNQNEQKQDNQKKLKSQKSNKIEEENKQNQTDRKINEPDKNIKNEDETKSKATEANKNNQNETDKKSESHSLAKKKSVEEEKKQDQLKTQEQNKFQIQSLKKADDSTFDFYKDSPRQEQQLTATEQNYSVENQLLSVNNNSDEDKNKKQHPTTIGRHQIKHEEKKAEATGFKPFVNSEIDEIRKELSSKQKNKIDKLEKKYGEFSDDDDEIERELEDSKEKQKNKNKLAGAFEEIDDDDF
ncbi:zinc finger, C2H2 type family protein (macronuclear) [Tetrahymena thermophila SB210]|uniref:Zinc finger, C2H2 type family protein n=1 Tax=Tetrahymena thermophila (strain SB210) TaxID=312017 RepID=I7MAX0_TETTS|nr:zinc finger, C2H2 type family protein [Tetrahymena thermophila SB210]EAS06305.2 zinc finger, C2H2 type family protein [Tetrahymena thermophila SB210]|eukprot:XP_001026550.2 zinc finger, C2H2 type family protein [Tetrahymena thermophila SB210]